MRTPARLLPLALAASLSSFPAAALGAPPPLPPGEARTTLESLVHLGAVSRADADRVIVEESLPEPLLAASESPGCGTVALVQTTRWLRDRGVRVSFVSPPGQYHVTSATFPIRVYYNVLGLAAKANDSLLDAEAAWQTQVVERGYRSPWTGGDGDAVSLGMDYYLTISDGTWGGLTEPLADVPSTPICDCSVRILIDQDLAGANLGSTIEHEFNHATQAATDCVESISAWETFAAAVDFIAFPGNSRVTIQMFQDWPQFPLDFWTSLYGTVPDQPSGYYQYGSCIYPLFLVDRFGDHDPKFLKDVWESFAETGTYAATCVNNPDWFQGLDNLLKTKGSSFNQGFTEFSAWRAVVGQQWDDGAHFNNGSTFSQPALTTLTALPASGDSDAREYGSRYFEIVPESGAVTAGPLSVTVTASSAASWSGSILLWRPSQTVQVVPIAFTGSNGAAQTGFLNGVTRVVVVVSQLSDGSHSTDGADYNNSRPFHYLVQQAAGLDAGPAGPDAARPAGRDAAHPTSGHDAGTLGSDAASGPDTHAGGCGCGLAGAPAGVLSLLAALALALRRRVR